MAFTFFRGFIETKSNIFVKIKYVHQNKKEQYKTKVFTAERTTLKEAFIAFKLAMSLAFAMLFEVGVQTVISVSLGHLPNSSEFLSATSLALAFCNMLPTVVTWGFSTALWTLIPQAVGSNQLHLVALYSQRAFVICTFVGIPFSFMLFNSENILKSIGIDSHNDMNWEIVRNYSRVLIPYPFLMTYLSILHRIGQNLGHHFAIVIIQAITFVLSMPLCYLLMVHLNKGYIAGALTLNLTLLSSNILLFLYLLMQGYSYLFRPIPFHQICDRSGISQFLTLGVPSCVQLVLAWITRESITILTGYVKDSSLALSYTAIMFQVYCIKFLHTGVGNAFGVRIGKYIGDGSIKFAKRSMKMQLCFELILMVVSYILFRVFGYEITSFVTNNQELIPLVSSNLIYVALINVFGVAIYRNVLSVYRAIGYQQMTVQVMFVAQYLITLPLQLYYLRQSTDDMLTGLYIVWNISSFGYYLADFVLVLMLIFYVDWNKALQDSKSRIEMNNKNVHTSELLDILNKSKYSNNRTL